MVWAGAAYLGARISNNVAEYNAALLGLQQAVRLPDVRGLCVRGDSLLVINQLLGADNVCSNYTHVPSLW